MAFSRSTSMVLIACLGTWCAPVHAEPGVCRSIYADVVAAGNPGSSTGKQAVHLAERAGLKAQDLGAVKWVIRKLLVLGIGLHGPRSDPPTGWDREREAVRVVTGAVAKQSDRLLERMIRDADRPELRMDRIALNERSFRTAERILGYLDDAYSNNADHETHVRALARKIERRYPILDGGPSLEQMREAFQSLDWTGDLCPGGQWYSEINDHEMIELVGQRLASIRSAEILLARINRRRTSEGLAPYVYADPSRTTVVELTAPGE